jgi:hypothetical protein
VSTVIVIDDGGRIPEALRVVLGARPGRNIRPLTLPVLEPAVHPRDYWKQVAAAVASAAETGSCVAVNLNLSVTPASPGAGWRRQDRLGVVIVEELRLNPSLPVAVIGYSFEPKSQLAHTDPFNLLFEDFSDCNRFWRLPAAPEEVPFHSPDPQRLEELAGALRLRQAERRQAEKRRAIENLLARFRHEQPADWAALIGPIKAALQSGFPDLAAKPAVLERVTRHFEELRTEAQFLPFEGAVRQAVREEIDGFARHWEVTRRNLSEAARPESSLEQVLELATRLGTFGRR